MFNVTARSLRTSRKLRYFWKYRVEARFKRFSRACRYATGALSADDAQTMIFECRDPAGWYPLLLLTVQDTLEQALEMYAPHSDLPRLIAAGCSRVDQKWEAHGDELYDARDWAIELAGDYAANEGIVLTRVDDDLAFDDAGKGEPQ